MSTDSIEEATWYRPPSTGARVTEGMLQEAARRALNELESVAHAAVRFHKALAALDAELDLADSRVRAARIEVSRHEGRLRDAIDALSSTKSDHTTRKAQLNGAMMLP